MHGWELRRDQSRATALLVLRPVPVFDSPGLGWYDVVDVKDMRN